MQLSCVGLSVCASVRSSHPAAARRCFGFAAVGPANDSRRVTVSALLSLVGPAHQLLLPPAALECDVF